MDYIKFEIITDRGGELVQVANLTDSSDTFWTKRSRLRRLDGFWVLLTDRQYDLLVATRNRKLAKATAPEIAA